VDAPDTGIGDDDVDPAEGVDAQARCRLQRGAISDVGDRRHDAPALLLDEPHGLVKIRRRASRIGREPDWLAQVDSNDVGALVRKGDCVRAALTSRCAGYERDLPVDPAHFTPPAVAVRRLSSDVR
jgi:hypothetical protein